MPIPVLQGNEIDSFKMANSLLKNPPSLTGGVSFEDFLDEAKEVVQKTKDKVSEIVNPEEKDLKKKNIKKEEINNNEETLTQIAQNIGRRIARDNQNSYLFSEKLKNNKRFKEEEPFKNNQQLSYNTNVIGQPLFQPVNDQTSRRMSKSQVLESWEKFTPVVTEDITKKAVRIDIPLLNDVKALVLRMNPDRSITASLLGSKEMIDLINQTKDKLDRNLRHHHLSLKEFNTYRSELEFTNESGTRKKKKQAKKTTKKINLDLI